MGEIFWQVNCGKKNAAKQNSPDVEPDKGIAGHGCCMECVEYAQADKAGNACHPPTGMAIFFRDK